MTSLNNRKEELLSLLKIHYGFDNLRLGQEQAIASVLESHDTVVIMPTGGGKSLCYQLPALLLEGITIVISPLIALMKDQVDSLNKIGIPATFINSSISNPDAIARLEDAKSGFYKLLYIAPERFYNQEFLQALPSLKVSLFAIDEAHCISQWGHDFRPSFMRLKQAAELVGRPPIIALTATATPEVKEDIIKQLELKNANIIITGFSRPNLQFGVIKTSENQKPQFILDTIDGFRDQAGIVYTGTRAKADAIVQILVENGIDAIGYHAGMDNLERQQVQESFMSGRTQVIVATNAFGMGIDKSDIRFVIHHDMPGTIEAYYQEAGRAGRDGQPSICLMLYSTKDRYLREFFIKGDNPSPRAVLEIYDQLLSYNQDKVLITYSELKKLISEDLPEMAVGTAVKILESEGYIKRSSEKNGQAFFKLLKTFEEAKAVLGKRAKKQIEILEQFEIKFAKEILNGWEANFDDVATMIGHKKDSVIRLFKKLHETEMAEYKPPFKGSEINILKRVLPENVNLNFSKLEDKLSRAYGKLDQMENYVYHDACRQKYILDYFGDETAQPCGKCDACLNPKAVKKHWTDKGYLDMGDASDLF